MQAFNALACENGQVSTRPLELDYLLSGRPAFPTSYVNKLTFEVSE